MHPSILQKKVTRTEAEAEYMVTDERLGPEPVPFGFMHGEWQRLVSKMQPGDELWTFSTDEKSWENLCGRSGISLVRDGDVIGSMVLQMN